MQNKEVHLEDCKHKTYNASAITIVRRTFYDTRDAVQKQMTVNARDWISITLHNSVTAWFLQVKKLVITMFDLQCRGVNSGQPLNIF